MRWLCLLLCMNVAATCLGVEPASLPSKPQSEELTYGGKTLDEWAVEAKDIHHVKNERNGPLVLSLPYDGGLCVRGTRKAAGTAPGGRDFENRRRLLAAFV